MNSADDYDMLGQRNLSKPESGLSMVALLVGIAIAGIVAAVVYALLGGVFRADASLSHRNAIQDLRSTLLIAVDCPDATRNPCTPGQRVALRRRLGDGTFQTIVPATGLVAGKHTVRAACDAEGDGIEVRIARLKPGASIDSTSAASFHPDPATGKIVTFSSPESLAFGRGVELCSYAAPDRTRSVQSSAPEAADRCSSGYNGGWCAGYWYKDVLFPRPFGVAPQVTVTMVDENAQGACGSTSDASRAEAINVTPTGFRMICSTTPFDVTCPGYGSNWTWSRCTWTAYEPGGAP